MCNCEHDFDKLVPKYCHKYTTMDKLVLSFVFGILGLITFMLLLQVLDPGYFSCVAQQNILIAHSYDCPQGVQAQSAIYECVMWVILPVVNGVSYGAKV